MRIAFCTNIAPVADPTSLRGRNHAIIEALVNAGHDVDVLYRPQDLPDADGPPPYDVGMLCPNDLYENVPDPAGRLNAETVAMAIELAGVRFVNSPMRRRVVTNKLLTHVTLGWAGLSRPQAWTLDELDDIEWPSDGVIVKPVTGSGGVGVALAHSPDEALAHVAATSTPCFLQRFIPAATCIRVIATQQASIGRYEKRVPAGTIVAQMTGGAEEVKLDPRADLDDLGVAVTRAVGLDITGIDILQAPDGTLFALEVNANFGFFPFNREIVDAIVTQVLAVATPITDRR